MDLATIIRYLLLPLRSAPLFLIVLFSGVLGFASVAGFFGIPLGFILLSWFFKYSFVLLDSATEGATEPPVLSVEMINPVDEQRPLVLLLIAVGIYFLSDAASHWFGPVTGSLAGLAAVAIVPAIVGVQGASGSVLQSFNPFVVIGLIARLRGDYVLILVCMLLLAGLSRAIVAWPAMAEVPTVVRIALLMYFWLAAYALIGGVLFTRRFDIGLEAAQAPEQKEARDNRDLQRERNLKIDRIYAEWRGGAKANAWKTVTALVDGSDEPVEELRWLHERAGRWPDPGLANRLARELLPKLLAAKHFGEALDVTQARVKADPNFRPENSSDLLTLIRLARDAGDRPTARILLSDFARHYPQSKEQRTVEILAQQLER